MDKYCQECGTERLARNRYCGECGTELPKLQSFKTLLLVGISIIVLCSTLYITQVEKESEVKTASSPSPKSNSSTSSRPSSTASPTYRQSTPAPPPMQSYTYNCTKVCKTREGFTRTVEISAQITVRARNSTDAYNSVDLQWRDYSVCDNAGLHNLMTGGNEYCSQR